MACVSPRLPSGVRETPRVFRTKHRGPRQRGPFVLFGAPGGIRTPDHLVRSQVLYPAELRALFKTLQAIHGENDRDSINPSLTIPGTAFVALRMFTEHSVTSHPAELRAQFKTVHAIHGEIDRDSINPSPTIPGTAFVALRMFTEHSVAPHPAELRAHLNNECGKASHAYFIVAPTTVRPHIPPCASSNHIKRES